MPDGIDGASRAEHSLGVGRSRGEHEKPFAHRVLTRLIPLRRHELARPARLIDLDRVLQVVRDWVLRFNAQGPDGLIDRKAPGQTPRLNETHRAALAAILESGPIPAVHGVVRWRIVDLCQWIFEEFRVVVAEQTLSRVLRAMRYRKLSARPRHHAQAEGAIEDFKKVFRPA